MNGTSKLVESAQKFLEKREGLYNTVINSPKFKATGVKLYPYDIVAANFPIILELLQTSECSDFFAENNIKTVLDLGGANGDLAFVFDGAGFETTVVDFSISYQKAPLVASLINLQLGANVRVADISVDGYFNYDGLLASTVNAEQFTHHSEEERFDLAVCFGLFYHLKNPFAFLESLSKLCRCCMLGTWLMSYCPDNLTKVRDISAVYFLGPGELNNDASNYWIFTEKSFRRLAERAGFSIISSVSSFVRDDKISNPVDPNYGERGFLLLRSDHVSAVG
jgi:2-polyprenyl-3-methyl-5-hydroxy-6-metoxy-1,4-benzoquinol methylase